MLGISSVRVPGLGAKNFPTGRESPLPPARPCRGDRSGAGGVPQLPPNLAPFPFRALPSLVAQKVKTPPAMQEIWVRFLGWEDPLEEEMAVHISILAWRIPMDRGAWRATVHRVAKSQTRLSD